MNKELWEKSVAFHGHECPGLAIGFKACEAAVEKMGIGVSDDEEIVCVTENDACGVDAVQALLSCTIGKGNPITPIFSLSTSANNASSEFSFA